MIYCLNPYNPNKGGDKPPVYFRCRQCRLCRVVRINEWKNRVFHEFCSFDKVGVFLTLTYREDNLPDGGTLVMSDLQKFIKRIRKNSGRKIKYFACGEYGDKGERPHYHLILLGFSSDDADFLRASWKQGFSYFGTVTPQSISYVAQYLNKRFVSKDKALMFARYGGRLPEFQVQSHGMGVDWLMTSPNVDFNDFTFKLFGKKIPLYRLAKEKFFIDPIEVYRAHQVRIAKGESVNPTRLQVRQCAIDLAAKASLKDSGIGVREVDSFDNLRLVYKNVLKSDLDVARLRQAFMEKAVEKAISQIREKNV